MGAQGMDWCRGIAEPKPNYPVLTCPKADPSWLRRKDSASQLSTCEEFFEEQKNAQIERVLFCIFVGLFRCFQLFSKSTHSWTITAAREVYPLAAGICLWTLVSTSQVLTPPDTCENQSLAVRNSGLHPPHRKHWGSMCHARSKRRPGKISVMLTPTREINDNLSGWRDFNKKYEITV